MEFEQVYQQAEGRLQFVMLLARDAGLRHEAIWNLTAANCNFETRTLSGKTKGGASYAVPMTQRLYERLLFVCASAQTSTEPLLCGFTIGRKKPGYGSIANWLIDGKKRAGVLTEWGLHDLRRTAARALYERTHDLRKVQRLLSHANMQQSCWYLGSKGIDLSPADLEGGPTCVHPPEQQKKSA